VVVRCRLLEVKRTSGSEVAMSESDKADLATPSCRAHKFWNICLALGLEWHENVRF